MKYTTILGRILYIILTGTFYLSCIAAIYFMQLLCFKPWFITFFTGLVAFSMYALAYFKTEVKQFLS